MKCSSRAGLLVCIVLLLNGTVAWGEENLIEEAWNGYENTIREIRSGVGRVQYQKDTSLAEKDIRQIDFAFDTGQGAFFFRRAGDPNEQRISTGGSFLAIDDAQYELKNLLAGNAVIRSKRGSRAEEAISPWHPLTLGLTDFAIFPAMSEPLDNAEKIRNRLAQRGPSATIVGSTIRIVALDQDRNHKFECWFDREQGYGCVRYFVGQLDGGPLIEFLTSWDERDGLWLPTSSTVKRPRISDSSCTVEWESVNKDIPAEVFTLDKIVGDDVVGLYTREYGDLLFLGGVGKRAPKPN